jgi:hypothetical protein
MALVIAAVVFVTTASAAVVIPAVAGDYGIKDSVAYFFSIFVSIPALFGLFFVGLPALAIYRVCRARGIRHRITSLTPEQRKALLTLLEGNECGDTRMIARRVERGSGG